MLSTRLLCYATGEYLPLTGGTLTGNLALTNNGIFGCQRVATGDPTVTVTLMCSADSLKLTALDIGVIYSNGTGVQNTSSVYFYGPGCDHMTVTNCNHLSSGLVPCSVYTPGGYPNPPVNMSGTVDITLSGNDCCYNSGSDTCGHCEPSVGVPGIGIFSMMQPPAVAATVSAPASRSRCGGCSRAKK